jgi:hypothetical protein
VDEMILDMSKIARKSRSRGLRANRRKTKVKGELYLLVPLVRNVKSQSTIQRVGFCLSYQVRLY